MILYIILHYGTRRLTVDQTGTSMRRAVVFAPAASLALSPASTILSLLLIPLLDLPHVIIVTIIIIIYHLLPSCFSLLLS